MTQKQLARKFVEYWTFQRGSEKGEDQQFWNSLLESTLNPVTRRVGGMVYTSIENIHKVIDPLFLDDLEKRLDDILWDGFGRVEGESVENVANVQMLPITNANSKLGKGEQGTGNWELKNGTGNIGNTGNIKKTPNLQNSKTPSNESNNSVPQSLCVSVLKTLEKDLHFYTSTRLNNSVSFVVKNISATAQSILDARALYPDSSLADLYDPLTMPIELRKAHAANDAAVMKAYGYAPTMTEPEIVADLMTRYQKLTMINS